jgi:hypothetical protein
MAVNSPILGHSGSLKIYVNGQLSGILTISEFNVDMQSAMNQVYYAGNAIPEGYQTLPHWTGNVELLVKDSIAEKLIDAIVGAVQSGVGFPQVVMNVTENYSDGTSSTYSYSDCQFKITRRQRGGQEHVTKRLEFQAMFRISIA